MDDFLKNLPAFLFWTLAGLTAACAIAVVVSQNIVRSATWLLFTLGGVSAIFFLLGADFVGATQLLVYVGGTLVLVIFGVMLTAQGPFITMRASAAEWAISAVVGLLLFGVLAVTLWQDPTTHAKTQDDPPREMAKSPTLGLGLLGLQEATDPNEKLTGVPGLSRYRTPMAYLLIFEIVSVHLLVVLIGAAYLARAKRKGPRLRGDGGTVS